MEYEEEVLELFDFDPEKIPVGERSKLAHDTVKDQFDHDSYLFDFYDNE